MLISRCFISFSPARRNQPRRCGVLQNGTSQLLVESGTSSLYVPYHPPGMASHMDADWLIHSTNHVTPNCPDAQVALPKENGAESTLPQAKAAMAEVDLVRARPYMAIERVTITGGRFDTCSPRASRQSPISIVWSGVIRDRTSLQPQSMTTAAVIPLARRIGSLLYLQPYPSSTS